MMPTPSRMQWMCLAIVAIGLWAAGDELAQLNTKSQRELLQLQAESSKLKRVLRDTELPARLATQNARSKQLKDAAYAGTTLTAARSAMAADIQALLALHGASGATYRLARATTTAQPGAQSGPQPGAQAAAPANDAAKNLPAGFVAEAFTVSGSFVPANMVSLLAEFARSERLINIDGFAVKGARFELLGTAVLYTLPGATEAKP